MATQSEFDQLVKEEIRRQGVRSNRTGDSYNQDARDAVARRLNAQEGRSRNSTAYKPSRDRPARTSRSTGTQAGGGRGGRPKSPRTSTPNLPDTAPVPEPNPNDTGGGELSLRNLLIPMLMTGALAAYAGRKAFKGANSDVVPPHTVKSQDMPVVLGSGRVSRAPLPINVDQEGVQALPYDPNAKPSVAPADNDPVGRFLTQSEIQQYQDRIKPNVDMESGTGGTVKPSARPNPDVNLPSVDSPAPGWRKPVITYRPKLVP